MRGGQFVERVFVAIPAPALRQFMFLLASEEGRAHRRPHEAVAHRTLTRHDTLTLIVPEPGKHGSTPEGLKGFIGRP